MKTAEVLIANPDVYTFWNIRKEVLLDIKINEYGELNFFNYYNSIWMILHFQFR